jgi:hypothetical protein
MAHLISLPLPQNVVSSHNYHFLLLLHQLADNPEYRFVRQLVHANLQRPLRRPQQIPQLQQVQLVREQKCLHLTFLKIHFKNSILF